jgi:fatty acid CoA ligase FadD9
MILAHSRYAGQLNVPDMFTRLLFSLAATGVAPSTFYAEDGSKGRPRARYDGIAVDFLADAITAIGARDAEGFHSYNLSSPYDDGVSLDSIVDWMIEAGCEIERIGNYSEWLSRFETAMHALPEGQRQASVLAIIGPYRHPQIPVTKTRFPTERFCAATQAGGYEIPHVSADLIHKYVADLRRLHLL